MNQGVAKQMEDRLRAQLSPIRLELVNESHLHNVPVGSESHWSAIIVSEAFAGKSLVQQHRIVYEALGEQLMTSIHALALKTLTPEEWRAAGETLDNRSPPCRGGEKRKP